MTNQQHPITPPLEMLQQWASEYWGNPGECLGNGEKYIATKAAQWSADQELEACCEYIRQWFADPQYRIAELRTARRPKPPTLKEEALAAFARLKSGGLCADRVTDESIVRRALEALPND